MAASVGAGAARSSIARGSAAQGLLGLPRVVEVLRIEKVEALKRAGAMMHRTGDAYLEVGNYAKAAQKVVSTPQIQTPAIPKGTL